MNEERKSNFELLRIISMLFIILYHVIVHGNVISNCNNEGLKTAFTIIEYIIVVHVNLFVLITGYFQSKSKFKQSKIWTLLDTNMFYKLIILLTFICLKLIKISKIEIFRELFILNLDEYWFIKYYLFLYCLSPFINKLIENLNKRMYKKLLITCFVIFSIIPYITNMKAFPNDGYTLYNFVYLYLIGGYLKTYPIKDSYLFKRCSKNLYRIILLMLFLFCPILNFLITKTSFSLIGINNFFDEISINLYDMRTAYSNPIIIIQSISFFLLFETFDIKSKIINNISKLTIGVYLIHDNNFIRSKLYTLTKINNGPITSYSFIIYAIIITIGTFIICAIIEELRQLIFKFIYKRKFPTIIRNNYYKFLNSIYLIKSESDN